MLLDLSPLRASRDYRLLFTGQLVSFFGSMMTFIVVPWQMYQLTGSSAMVGYIYLAEFVPMVILAFVGGAMADFFDKRKLLRVTEIGQTTVTAILLVNALLPQPQVWVLFVAVALHAGLAAIQRPAFESFIQKVIPVEMMSAVMALNSIRYSLGAIVSPALAGIIATQFSSSIAYAFDLLTFIASLIAVFMIRAVPPPANAEKPSFQSIKRAWKYAFSRQELVGTYFIDIAAMFFAMPQALYPALAVIYGEKYVGFFPAAIAGGALVASLTSGWTRNINRHGLLVTIAAVLWGVAIMFFGLVDSIVPALLFLAAAGFFDMISGIFRGSIWNQTIPNYLRGRLASIEMMSYLTGPMLGSAKMGIVAEKFGVKSAIVSGGILCVVAVLGAAVFLPKFATYDGREGVKHRELEEAQRAEMSDKL
ncbi:MAG TPA: MFS transporter [Pyrinomonadaceae bacterium]|nr:MFS transporter [Chloracidobacterium sp.]HQX56636.1 MFS transporter [Pyrinomonadaceae bacterium]MBK7804583.1 MFS transporter [Chloracidobacterium sp.]MBK9768595.1 MFS transporter [Chloracidobacterium sp.]MBL0240505.1 MFS transporter [Chloracidobacterium sp.]